MQILGMVLSLTGVGVMGCFFLALFFPSLLNLLWSGPERLPRLQALLGILSGFILFCFGGALVVGLDQTGYQKGVAAVLMISGMATALAFFAAFLFPSILKFLQVRPAGHPRLRALAGILAGGVLILAGGLVSFPFDGEKLMRESLAITGSFMAWGAILCFFLAFLYPPLLDTLRIGRGRWPRLRAIQGMAAGLVFFFIMGLLFFEA